MIAKHLDKFTLSYIETALWAENDGSDDSGGVPFDKNYSIDDIDEESLRGMINDCAKFQSDNANLLIPYDLSQCGHDFWLTRNGHGAGFWDGDYSEPEATKLTDASKAFGTCNLYLGDNGKIHCS
jgi:hypothetical protein